MQSDDGLWIKAHRDSNGRVSSVSDSTGRSVTYIYNNAGDLVSVTGSGGNQATYGYDSKHRIVSLTPPASGTTTNQYDSSDRVIKQTAPDGGVTSFTYTGNNTTVTQPDGAKMLESYTDSRLASRTIGYGTPLAAVTTFTYTTRSQVASTTDPTGRITSFVYDHVGNLRQMVDTSGGISTYDYDEHDNLVLVRNAIGAEASFTYDNRGNVTSATDALGNTFTYEIDLQGRRVSTTDPYGNSSSVDYDEFSNPEVSVSPAGVKTVVEADALGRVTRAFDARAFLPGATASDFDTSYSYNPLGLIESITDPSGASVSTTYDAAGRVKSTTDALGRTATVTYDSSGRPTAVTDIADRTTTYTYDKMGRTTSVTSHDGRTSTAAYDVLGRVTTSTDAMGGVTSVTYNVADQPVTVQDPDGRTTTNRYNALGRLEAVINPMGAETTYVQDSLGRVTKVTDAGGRATTYTYDAAGRLTKTQYSDGSSATTVYDKLGRVESSTDTSGRTSAFEYDAEGRVTHAVDILGRETTSVYEAGYMVSQTGSNGVVSSVAYDSRGYASQTTTGSAHTTHTAIDAAGRVTSTTESAGTTTFGYDGLDRIISVDGPTGDVGYTYDAAGNLGTLTYPSGRVVTREHDDLGRPVGIFTPGVGEVDFTWTPGGLLDQIAYPNGVTNDLGFDDAGRLTSIDLARGEDKLLGLDYGLSADGRLESRSTQHGSAASIEESFGADALGRLSPTVNGAPTVAYTPSHEVTALPDGTAVTFTAAGVPEVVTGLGGTVELTHDAVGQRTHETNSGTVNAEYGWNDLGQLTSVESASSGVDVDYLYAGGLRVSAVGADADGAINASYVWDTSSGVPLLLSDGTHEFIYGTGTAPIAQVNLDTGDVEFLHGDVVGSTRTVTDASGAVVAELDYEMYGKHSVVSGDGAATRFLFAGEYLDPAGDYYLRNRVFDPETASFLSVDPIVSATGMPYAYTAGNPLQGTDPLGLYGWGDFGDDLASAGSAVWDEVSSPEFIASTATFVGCTVITGGVGAVGCAAVAGAVYSAVDYAANTPPECMTWDGFFGEVATGFAYGAVGGVLFGPAASRVVSVVGSALSKALPVVLRQSVSSVASSGAQAVRQYTSNTAQRVSSVMSRVRGASGTDAGRVNIGAVNGPGPNTAVLQARASEVHGALDPIAQSSRTTAVLSTQQGQTVLAGGGRDLSPAQRALAKDGEILARDPGSHAEVTAVRGAINAGLNPRGIGVSRPICSACQGFLESSGATITSPTTAWWARR